MDHSKGVPSELRDWVTAWRAAGPALAEIKRAELRRLDTLIALQQLADAFEMALRTAPTTNTSGLVDQQRILLRLRQ